MQAPSTKSAPAELEIVHAPVVSLMRLRDALYTRLFRLLHARRFARFGRKSRVNVPRDILNPASISIGDDVEILHFVLLAATRQTGEPSATLEIGDGCRLGANNHIYATRRITLGRHVLTAGNVYIADNAHTYANPDAPVLAQPVRQLRAVTIGDGAWLGVNVCVIGACVGRGAVVGGNSVVTQDIPDHCVAVGTPARIVKRLDRQTGRWRPTRPDGMFAACDAEP